jgi:hypothetical protein
MTGESSSDREESSLGAENCEETVAIPWVTANDAPGFRAPKKPFGQFECCLHEREDHIYGVLARPDKAALHRSFQ